MYRFLEHVADLEVEVEAESFERLVEESIKAVTEAVAEDVDEEKERVIEVSGRDEEEILMNALEEVIFLQAMGFYVKKAEVRRKDGGIEIKLKGGKARVKDEIKAVTWHGFKVEKNGGWKAHFICDL